MSNLAMETALKMPHKRLKRVIESGAIGLNLEDANHQEERQLIDLSLQLEKIKAVQETAGKARSRWF